MKDLSINTEKFITIIDNINNSNNKINTKININHNYFNSSNIKKYYDLIFNLYNNINYNILSHKINYIQTIDYCDLFNLFKFLLNNKLIDDFKNIGYNNNSNTILENIIRNECKKHLKIWINLKGQLLLRKIYLLKEENIIPNSLLENLEFIDADILSEFTPFDIFEYLGNSNLIKYNFLLEFSNTKVTLKIITKKNINKSILNRIIKNIYLLVSIKKLKDNIVEDFNISLVLTTFKKSFTKGYNILGPREINSGVCIFNKRTILIFRKEEYEKLLIHELCHLLKLDFSIIDLNNISNYVNINPKYEIRINESITEILALIIHSITVSINLSDNKNYNLASLLINYEINFNLIQISKILNYFNFKNSKEFFSCYDNGNKFKQTTSVLSYFIIKTACLFNKKLFHSFLDKNFTNLNYNNKQIALENYKILVIKSLQNKHLYNYINLLMSNINTNNRIFIDTLRMTCIELK